MKISDLQKLKALCNKELKLNAKRNKLQDFYAKATSKSELQSLIFYYIFHLKNLETFSTTKEKTQESWINNDGATRARSNLLQYIDEQLIQKTL